MTQQTLDALVHQERRAYIEDSLAEYRECHSGKVLHATRERADSSTVTELSTSVRKQLRSDGTKMPTAKRINEVCTLVASKGLTGTAAKKAALQRLRFEQGPSFAERCKQAVGLVPTPEPKLPSFLQRKKSNENSFAARLRKSVGGE